MVSPDVPMVFVALLAANTTRSAPQHAQVLVGFANLIVISRVSLVG